MLIYFVVVQVLGKTTSARIIANEMNNYKGKPIEIDCATHNGVDDMRQLQEQCQTRPLDCKYKIFKNIRGTPRICYIYFLYNKSRENNANNIIKSSKI